MYNEQHHLVMCTGHSLHKVMGCMDLDVKTALAQLKQQVRSIIHKYMHMKKSHSLHLQSLQLLTKH
jgi:hypothetical protein